MCVPTTANVPPSTSRSSLRAARRQLSSASRPMSSWLVRVTGSRVSNATPTVPTAASSSRGTAGSPRLPILALASGSMSSRYPRDRAASVAKASRSSGHHDSCRMTTSLSSCRHTATTS